MGDFSRPGVGNDLLDKLCILAIPCIQGSVLKVKVLEDSIRRKLNTGLLVTDRPFRADSADIPSVLKQFAYVPGKVRTRIIRLKGAGCDLIINQCLCLCAS